MSKVRYNNITFDSELEIEYYKHLEKLKEQGELNKFYYHFKHPIHINSKSTYTPDFICFYADRIEIVETKGFNSYSYMRDSMVHNAMLEKTTDELLEFLYDNGVMEYETEGKDVIYKKIKYLKTFGWVDFDFKNPNTIANKRKEKIVELEAEIKDLKEYKKKNERYFDYVFKMKRGEKLNKAQKAWFDEFVQERVMINYEKRK